MSVVTGTVGTADAMIGRGIGDNTARTRRLIDDI